MNTRSLFFSAFFFICVLFAGSAQGERPREIWERYTVAFIGEDTTNLINGPARQGALDAAKVLEHQHHLAITLVDLTPTPGNGQSSALREAFIKGAHAVLISVSEPKTIEKEFDLMARQGVHIVTFDQDAPDSPRLATVSTDNAAIGQIAFDHAAKKLPRGGNLAVLVGNADAPVNQERLAAVQLAAEANPQVSIQAVYPCIETVDGAINVLREVQATDQDEAIDGWILLGPWPLLGVTPLPWKPGEQVCVAVDALPPMLAYVGQKQVDALVAQLYYRWGYLAMEAAINAVHLKQPPPLRVIQTGGEVISRNNLKSYSQDWVQWMQ
ncbi:substrate-binding domain-containing protein [Cerasicoccus arenae]|uniref:Periplasmic binding protein domain-containing protein n=1 Tax=Cerasicoccus arenae TaxID=424488 RepID=A0A8J3DL45_9BACT|nr:substrate-binding domain-containing protein [Cerasicoccus arenae]MBK1858527.1 substrate-binding domain-containing protein [Cerasicoccus arenae]GHC06110.1 hypothetical protein GCM10007047_23940 [Cerasicoccus arenae]